MHAKEHKDVIADVFGLEVVDRFHPEAPAGTADRLYRRQKAVVCDRFITREGGKEKVFLDAGAGLGPYTYLAAAKFKTVYCFEFDKTELEGARKNVGELPNVVFGEVDLTSIPLPDNSVDNVICSEVLEHIPKHEQAAKELYRVMKPGGHLLFSMPNNNSMFYRRVSRTERIKSVRAKEFSTLDYGDWEALRHVSFSPKDIEHIVTSAGFTIEDRFGANIISLPGFLRRFVERYTFTLKLFTMLQEMLARPMAKFGAYYFLELIK